MLNPPASYAERTQAGALVAELSLNEQGYACLAARCEFLSSDELDISTSTETECPV